MDMTIREARNILYNKMFCMDICAVHICNSDECNNCKYCYEQGTTKQQIEAIRLAIVCMDNFMT